MNLTDIAISSLMLYHRFRYELRFIWWQAGLLSKMMFLCFPKIRYLFLGLRVLGVTLMAAATVNLAHIFWFMSSRDWLIILNANHYGEAVLEYPLVLLGAFAAVPVMVDYLLYSCRKMKEGC